LCLFFNTSTIIFVAFVDKEGGGGGGDGSGDGSGSGSADGSASDWSCSDLETNEKGKKRKAAIKAGKIPVLRDVLVQRDSKIAKLAPKTTKPAKVKIAKPAKETQHPFYALTKGKLVLVAIELEKAVQLLKENKKKGNKKTRDRQGKKVVKGVVSAS